MFVCLSVLFSSTFCAFASTEIYEGDSFGQDYEDISVYSNNEDTTKGNFTIRYNFGFGSTVDGIWTHKKFLSSKTVYDNQMPGYSNVVTFPRVDPDFANVFNYSWSDQFVIERTDKTKIASKSQSLNFSVKDFTQQLQAYDNAGNKLRDSFFTLGNVHNLYMFVYDQAGTPYKLLTLSGADANKYLTVTDDKMTIAAEIDNLPCDVYKVNVFITYAGMGSFNNNNGDANCTSTAWNYPTLKKVWGYGDDSTVVLKVDDNTSGLLSSIIEFIKSILEGVQGIFSKIGDFMTSVANSFSTLFSKLGTWFANLIDSIIQLPSKIWTLFENGLKALFVPDDEFIHDYKDNWETVLEERFGAIYQACDIVVEFVSGINFAAIQPSIEIPTVTLDLPDNTTFEFGGYNVLVVPQGFEFLADAVKLAVDIVCSFLVVNSLKRRFEGLLGDRL